MPQTGIGALIGWGLGAYGSKPKVPELRPIDPTATQAATIKGNQANFADAAKLAASVNTFNQDQLNTLIDKALGLDTRLRLESNINSMARGEIPQDVQDQIYRGVAQRTAAGNAFGGGGFTRNVTARDLGLTSLDLTSKALSSAENWLSQAKAPQMDVTSMFFSPQQRLAFEQQQQGMKYQRDLMAAGVAAAPDPAMAALAEGFDNDIKTMSNAALSYAGMMGGGGGGMMGGLSGGASGGSSYSSRPQQFQWFNSNNYGGLGA